MRGSDGLFALNLDASELGITAAGLAPLVGLPNLGWLAVDAKDDCTCHYIARMPRLRFLGCQDTVAGDDGFVGAESVAIDRVHLGTALPQLCERAGSRRSLECPRCAGFR